MKEMGALRKAGVFESIKKAVRLTSSEKAVVVEPIKKSRPTLNKKGPVFGEWTWWEIHSHMVEMLLRQLCFLPFFFHGRIPT